MSTDPRLHRPRISGARSLTAAAAAVLLAILSPDVVAAQAPPPPVTVDTPALQGEVFNEFVEGAFEGGEFGTRDEILGALRPNDPFYAEPLLTGTEKPGTLLKAKRVEVMFTGFKPANLEAYKIMYVTTGNDGVTPTISTGFVMIPVDGVPASEKKVIGYQEANDSVGAYCHPSTQWTGGDPLDGASWSALGPLALMFGKGYAVVISDVGNDADPDPHGVFAAKFAGHAQLDALRAATSGGGTGLSPQAPIALFGVAGGGVGAASAAEMQAGYAPELNIKSTVLEGMVIDQRSFMRTADGSVGSGFAFATLLGLEPWYPEMRINDKLNPVGRALADEYRVQCQMPSYFTAPFVPLRLLFSSGQSPVDIPEFQHVYDDNRLGGQAPRSKVLISSCGKDDSPMSLVPAQDSRDLAARYRAGGTDVTYAPSDCNLNRLFADPYGWGTDLFGMQTIDWIDRNFAE